MISHPIPSLFSVDTPPGFRPQRLVSVGRYILMLPDTLYADKVEKAGHKGVHHPLMYDPVSGEVGACQPLPGGRVLAACMLSSVHVLLVQYVEGVGKLVFRLLTLASQVLCVGHAYEA
ncbi:hypothetical protein KIPB_010313 [Kipferlia bialata]|uniref:Uncharacterized protein n=1 Tax=Kipferlia bialata TaxID=797122 RepID=A0A391NS29_9EUKA|nr:hypothetical protein KIPB_010313 [Kipferlia bialata]|eukprot:g10313.t1